MSDLNDTRALKRRIRRQSQVACGELAGKDDRSRIIWSRFTSLEAYRRAGVVMSYVNTEHEVRTREFLPVVVEQGKMLVVPYCDGDELGLFRFENIEELAPGMLGILEPPEDLRRRPEKRVDAERLDLVMVPGAAFDARGGRIGRGKGYYDRLLRRTRPDALRVGVAFQCQIFPGVPMQKHDVFMDKVITEDTVYEGMGGARMV